MCMYVTAQIYYGVLKYHHVTLLVFRYGDTCLKFRGLNEGKGISCVAVEHK